MFCSSNNKILLDYRAFRDMINARMKAIEANLKVLGSSKKQTPAGGAQLLATEKGERFLHPARVSTQGVVAVKTLIDGRSSTQEFTSVRNGQRHSEAGVYRKDNSNLLPHD